MSFFNDEEYELLISELIQDTFYIKLSNRGKIKNIRQFSEILVRKILGIGSDRQIMLGRLKMPSVNKKGEPTGGAKEELEKLYPYRRKELLEIIEKTRPLGNEATHTQHTLEFKNDELEQVIDALFDLYAFLFIEYFLKYPMTIDTKPEIYHDFSLLPPIIRYKTLDYLFQHGKTNVYVADRLSLAIVKAYDKETALKWLYDNKEILEKDIYPNQDQYQITLNQSLNFLVEENKTNLQNLIIENGVDNVNAVLMEEATKLTEKILEVMPFKNSFELCLDKINKVSDLLQEKGKLYETFEQAISYFQKQKNETNSPELTELHNIMEFVYLGRDSNKA